MTTLSQFTGMDSKERAVRSRYAAGAERVEAELCCPVDYDARLLEHIPEEIIRKDYGCGDPTRHVAAGETVLDLGSGCGKICYMLSQVVGPQGRVIGVDFNTPMLAVARKHCREFASRVGYDNLEFRKGRIQDLRLNLELLEEWLGENPVRSADDYLAMDERAECLRTQSPLIPDESVDVVVSNCVLNLVPRDQRSRLFREMHRVLRRGGRAVICDISCDEPVPEMMQADPQLWSGCISGAFVENEFLAEFDRAGFYGVEALARAEKPWQTVDGIEFRSMTVRAFKGKEGPCLDRNQAVLYRGPWKAVIDDDGHTLFRGQRMAVCDKTFGIYSRPPYAEDVIPIEPLESIPLDDAPEFDCRKNATRPARSTKGLDYHATDFDPDRACCDDDACC